MTRAERSWQSIPLPAPWPAPAGAYSPAVRAGDFVFLSGQVPMDARAGGTVGDDVTSQTRQVFENAARALEAAGASLQDVVSVTAYLASMADWPAFDLVYREMFEAPWPARTTVGAELRGFLVELSFTAYAPLR